MSATALDRTPLSELSRVVGKRLGLHFPEERWPDLLRGLMTAASDLGFDNPGACARWLTTREPTVRQLEALASHLTVGETYFFRDPKSFELLAHEILPPLMAGRAGTGRTLRLWSAGCSTGEEAYSLAITCLRAGAAGKGWSVSVLATDINPASLAKAEAGVYTEWSFRGTPVLVRERYFSPSGGGKFMVSPAARALVRFDYLNLAEDAYPSLHNATNAMDVIFCRNVLMYFTPEHQRQVVAALHRCLVDGAWLVVAPAEASAQLFPMFEQVAADGAILYRKSSRTARAPPPLALARASIAPELPVPSAPSLRPPGRSSRPPDPLARARALADEGKLEEALASCQQAIATERMSPVAHFLCGTILHELGRPEEAVSTLNRVLYLDQDFILAHHTLAGLHRRLGRARKAAQHRGVVLQLLEARAHDEIVPESGGMTCGRLLEAMRAQTGA